MRLAVVGLVPSLLFLFLSASPARAGEVQLTQVKATGAGPVGLTVKGKLTAPADVELPASVELRCGTYSETLASGSVVQSGTDLEYRAPKGTSTGLVKFRLSLKSGKFSLAARAIDVGPLDEPLSLTLDLGGQDFTALLPMGGKGRSRTWRKGQPLQAVLTGRLIRVGSVLGNPVLTPVGGASFVRDDAEEVVAVVGGNPATDADGVFALTLETEDPSALASLDLGALLGEESTLTRPGMVATTAGEDGTLEAVAFVQTRSPAGGTVTPGAPSSFEVTGTNGAPSGTLAVPAGAVTAAAPGVSFTPYTMAAELPAPLPEGYIALAGAEVRAASPLLFVAANAPTVEVSRPRWTEKGPLATADIRLLQFRSGQWEEQPGSGFYNTLTDRLVADPFSPAKLAEAAPAVYAAKVTEEQGRALEGTVVDGEGEAVEGATVLSRAGGVVSGRSGKFKVPRSTVTSSALEVVQVVGAGSTTGRVVSAAEAESGEVTVQTGETEAPDWLVGVVLGTVYQQGGSSPSPGAKVTLSIAGAVRGLLHDTAETDDNFADDQFAVPDLTSLGVTTYEWGLTIPGDEEEFVSTLYTGNTVNPSFLMLEAQAADRTITDGAYTVRVAYDIPGLGERRLFGGFRVTSDGLEVTVSDVQVPAGFEGSPSVEVTANSQGQYVKFYRAPPGIPMTATATSAAGTNTVTRSFFFDSFVTIDLSVDAPTPEGIPIGWSVRASMPTPRESMAIGVVDGKIYVAGGTKETGAEFKVLEVYDPTADTWETKDELPVSRKSAFYGVLDGKLVVAGGQHFTGFPESYSISVDAYDSESSAWASKSALNTARGAGACGVVSGKLLVCGGLNSTDGILGSVEQYDPLTNVWTSRQPLSNGRYNQASAVVDGILYAMGGCSTFPYGSVASDEVWAYSSISDSWSSRAKIPLARTAATAGVIDGEIYLVGGAISEDPGREYFTTVYIYNPGSNGWRRGPDIPGARGGARAVVVGGVLYVIGGRDHYEDVSTDSVYAYRPK